MRFFRTFGSKFIIEDESFDNFVVSFGQLLIELFEDYGLIVIEHIFFIELLLSLGCIGLLCI
jgi:hypothetical protein